VAVPIFFNNSTVGKVDSKNEIYSLILYFYIFEGHALPMETGIHSVTQIADLHKTLEPIIQLFKFITSTPALYREGWSRSRSRRKYFCFQN
jgi:hypothetical protein